MRLAIVLWLCDLCGEKAEQHSNPTGWEWFRSAMTGGVGHRCASCVGKTAPEHRGLPLGVESATQFFARK